MENTGIVDSIKRKLEEIERKENVRVIMAVESGSRAWGFASADSDYDVRFIYVRRTEDYLKLMPMRDVIEWQLDDVYDINGWDLNKALRLLHDANPTMFEWCNSPIVYKENALAGPLRDLAEKCFLPKKALYHYISMASRNYDQYLSDDEVRLKKYFYVLRPILAARWVVNERTAPPMLFRELCESQLDPEMKPVIERLLQMKMEASELGTGPKIPEVDEYIREQLRFMQDAANKEENRKNGWDELDHFFRMSVMS